MTSRALFNRYSWSGISLRKIASELEISDGNLRYHYKTKEKIVLELFSMMTQEMAIEIENRNEEASTLQRNSKNVRIMYAYRFLFIESNSIKKSYPSYLLVLINWKNLEGLFLSRNLIV